MRTLVTRRETLVAGGAASALALLKGNPAAANNLIQEQKLSWENLKVNLSSPYISTQVKTQKAGNLPPLQDVEATLHLYKDAAGARLAQSYQTTCDPSRTTVLKVNGQDLRIADWVSFGLGAIQWKAGEGWPLYTIPDPKHDYSIHMKWNAYIHGILVGCLHDDGSITFTAPFAEPGVYKLGAGRVVAFVNDDDYSDNRGYFNIDVFGWT